MNLLIIFCPLPAGHRGGTTPRLGRSARQFQAPARIDTISRPGGLEEVCSQKRSSWGDRGFESPFLQRRVSNELYRRWASMEPGRDSRGAAGGDDRSSK